MKRLDEAELVNEGKIEEGSSVRELQKPEQITKVEGAIEKVYGVKTVSRGGDAVNESVVGDDADDQMFPVAKVIPFLQESGLRGVSAADTPDIRTFLNNAKEASKSDLLNVYAFMDQYGGTEQYSFTFSERTMLSIQALK